MKFTSLISILFLSALQMSMSSVNAQCTVCDYTCYVVDPGRTQAPWSGSNQAWPQCYDPNTFVCQQSVYFICPTTSPVVCGRECFVPGTDCSKSGQTTQDYSGTTFGCNSTATATPAPTPAATTSSSTIQSPSSNNAATNGTVAPTDAACFIPLEQSQLPALARGAVRMLLDFSGSGIVSNLLCNTPAFQSSIVNDLGVSMNIQNPQNIFTVQSAYYITAIHTIRVVIDVLGPGNSNAASTASPPLLQHSVRRMNQWSRMRVLATGDITSAGYVQQIKALTSTQLSSTTYLKYANTGNVQVSCPAQDNAFTSDCPTIFTAPAAENTANTRTTDTNTTSTSNGSVNYWDTNKYTWIVPVLAGVGGGVLLLIILYTFYIFAFKNRKSSVENSDAVSKDGKHSDTEEYDEAAIPSIPVGHVAALTAENSTVSTHSPSSKQEYIYVPEKFQSEKENEKSST